MRPAWPNGERSTATPIVAWCQSGFASTIYRRTRRAIRSAPELATTRPARRAVPRPLKNCRAPNGHRRTRGTVDERTRLGCATYFLRSISPPEFARFNARDAEIALLRPACMRCCASAIGLRGCSRVRTSLMCNASCRIPMLSRLTPLVPSERPSLDEAAIMGAVGNGARFRAGLAALVDVVRSCNQKWLAVIKAGPQPVAQGEWVAWTGATGQRCMGRVSSAPRLAGGMPRGRAGARGCGACPCPWRVHKMGVTLAETRAHDMVAPLYRFPLPSRNLGCGGDTSATAS